MRRLTNPALTRFFLRKSLKKYNVYVFMLRKRVYTQRSKVLCVCVLPTLCLTKSQKNILREAGATNIDIYLF